MLASSPWTAAWRRSALEVEHDQEWDAVFVLGFKIEPFVLPALRVLRDCLAWVDLAQNCWCCVRQVEVVFRADNYLRRELTRHQQPYRDKVKVIFLGKRAQMAQQLIF